MTHHHVVSPHAGLVHGVGPDVGPEGRLGELGEGGVGRDDLGQRAHEEGAGGEDPVADAGQRGGVGGAGGGAATLRVGSQ